VFGAPAYAIELSGDCISERAQWQLNPAVAGTFTLLNVETGLVLDVRAGADVPGTPIILYDPNSLDNQRFWLRPRADDAYELAPRHAPALCAAADTSDIEIDACEPANRRQDFHFTRIHCP
jgi:Ricin-type beta-trefoil lectin domain-like